MSENDELQGSSIIVSVSELRSRVQDLRRKGLDFVELTIYPSGISDGEPSTGSLEFSGSKRSDTSQWADFEELYAVEDEKELEEKSLNAYHMSDDLF